MRYLAINLQNNSLGTSYLNIKNLGEGLEKLSNLEHLVLDLY